MPFQFYPDCIGELTNENIKPTRQLIKTQHHNQHSEIFGNAAKENAMKVVIEL